MKKTLLLLIVASTLLSCASNTKHNTLYYKKIQPKDLKKDVSYVQKQLVKMHPDLNWYITKENLDYKFDSLKNSIKTPLTANEFYLKISPIVASVHQGHMNMSMRTLIVADSLKKKYKKSTNPLEHFEYAYLNNKLYITKNKSKTDSIVQIGSEVLAINGVSPQYLYTKYRKTLTSDGYNQTGIPKFFARRINNLYVAELGFLDSISIDLKCGNEQHKTVVKRKFVTKEQNTSKNTNVKKDTLSKAEQKVIALKKAKEDKALNKRKALYGYDHKNKIYIKEVSYPIANDSTTAILKIKDFSEGQYKVYDTIFSEFKKNNVQHLIIDLRGNPGGRLNDIYKLSQFLNDSTYQFIQPATITNRFTFLNMLKGKSTVSTILSAPFVSIFSTIRAIKATKNDQGEIVYPLKSSKPVEPKINNYKNKIYVITDGMTFSAAAIISSHLKGRNRALFVGEETGGTYNGTVAGIMPELKLPKSKLGLRVGLMTIKPVEQNKIEGYGIQPDIEIKPTIDQLINNEDPELQWILNHIKENKQK